MMAVTIQWLGHCAFRLNTEGGPVILIDPFDESIGLKVPEYECDILILTHDHYDTSAKRLVKPGYELISEKGTTFSSGVAFFGIPWWHDSRKGKDFGSALIYVFELDGLKIGYLSHIGSLPSRWVVEHLENLDICFVPVGGIFTLSSSDATFLMKEISPKMIIPMHFNLRYMNFTLGPLSDFTRLLGETRMVDDWEVTLGREDIPSIPTVLLMQHWPGVWPE